MSTTTNPPTAKPSTVKPPTNSSSTTINQATGKPSNASPSTTDVNATSPLGPATPPSSAMKPGNLTKDFGLYGTGVPSHVSPSTDSDTTQEQRGTKRKRNEDDGGYSDVAEIGDGKGEAGAKGNTSTTNNNSNNSKVADDGKWMVVAEELITMLDSAGKVVTDMHGSPTPGRVGIEVRVEQYLHVKSKKIKFLVKMRYAGSDDVVFRAKDINMPDVPTSAWTEQPDGRRGWRWVDELADATNFAKTTPAQRFEHVKDMFKARFGIVWAQ
ncbi:hypothetical protein MBLNU230_g4867t1 [Neophaeotheca triangularis]